MWLSVHGCFFIIENANLVLNKTLSIVLLLGFTSWRWGYGVWFCKYTKLQQSAWHCFCCSTQWRGALQLSTCSEKNNYSLVTSFYIYLLHKDWTSMCLTELFLLSMTQKILRVGVIRNGQETHLVVTPQKWTGKGLLGYLFYRYIP